MSSLEERKLYKMGYETKLTIFTDGGSRGNPGPSALGVFISDDNGVVAEIGKTLGITTNNSAEYQAVIEALSYVVDHNLQQQYGAIDVFMDSELLCRQLNGIYRVKSPSLLGYLMRIRDLSSSIHIPITYSHVRREKNKQADRLVNMALDGKI